MQRMVKLVVVVAREGSGWKELWSLWGRVDLVTKSARNWQGTGRVVRIYERYEVKISKLSKVNGKI